MQASSPVLQPLPNHWQQITKAVGNELFKIKIGIKITLKTLGRAQFGV